MRKASLILIFFFVWKVGIAQDSIPNRQVTVGMNFYPFSPGYYEAGRYTPDFGYHLGYKARYKDSNWWKRAGLNFNFYKPHKLPNNTGHISTAINIGIEHKFYFFNKHLGLYMGGDILPYYFFNATRINVHISKIKGYGLILGTVGGIEINATKRFSISTESSIAFGYAVKETPFSTNKEFLFDSYRLLSLSMNYKF